MERILGSAIVALLPLAPAPAVARFEDGDAVHVCRQEARAKSGASGVRNPAANLKAPGSCKVIGTMSRRGQADAAIRCRVENGGITEPSLKDDGGGGAGAARGTAP